MAQILSLTVTATPGRVQSFSAKTPSSDPQITKLSTMALPGRVQSFIAKTPASTSSILIILMTHYRQRRA